MASLIPDSVYNTVAPIFHDAGVPDYIWLSIAHMETGGTFNPQALGDNGASYGLFQLFTRGGQGDAYAGDPTVLFDPQLNAKVASREITKAYYTGLAAGVPQGPELAAYVAANSGHPNATPAGQAAVDKVRQLADFYFNVTGAGNTRAPGTPGGGPVPPASNPSYGTTGFSRFMWGSNPDGSARTAAEAWADQKAKLQTVIDSKGASVVTGAISSAIGVDPNKKTNWVTIGAVGIVATVLLLAGTMAFVNGGKEAA